MIHYDLYRLAPKDRQLAFVQPLKLVYVQSLAALQVGAQHLCPKGYVDVINYLTINHHAGAGQTGSTDSISMFDVVNGQELAKIYLSTAAPALDFFSSALGGSEIVMTEAENITAFVNFNALVNINTVSLTVFGMRIPRGNFPLR